MCHLNFRADLSAAAWCFSVRCPKRLSALPQLALAGEELPCDTEEILHGGEVEVRCQGVWPEAVAEARAAEEHFRVARPCTWATSRGSSRWRARGVHMTLRSI